MTEVVKDSYNLLHGVFSVYKPVGLYYKHALLKLKALICEGLNKEAELRPPKLYLDVNRSSSEISMKVRPSYAANSLCSGPVFRNSHIDLQVLSPLDNLTSGVMVLCVNVGENIPKILKSLSFTKCYHLKGILGQATLNFHIDDRVIAKAKYENVNLPKLQKILANYQGATQRRIFEEYGFSLQSQEAYDFAVNGLYRPTFKGPPIIYSLKVVDFEPPEFTIEVQCVNETQKHLLYLIHNLGLYLKSYATCAGIRCIRHGCFYAEHTLLKREWKLTNILENIEQSREILKKYYDTSVEFSPTVTTSKNQKQNSSQNSVSNIIKGGTLSATEKSRGSSSIHLRNGRREGKNKKQENVKNAAE